MKIKTITCHNVYNAGASLQAYALTEYLNQLGYDVEIIDYVPEYLRHYKLFGVGNSAYNKPFLREAYQLAKFPGRLLARYGKRKRSFDSFTKKYLPLTEKCYSSNEELKMCLPKADIYIAGSDQIWNTFFKNGKDPAFYLDFAPKECVKASYAASFATESIDEKWKAQIAKWLSDFDCVSVRESSGIVLANALGISDVRQVLDPVFLLDREHWKKLCKPLLDSEKYLLVYDFDNNQCLGDLAKKIAKEKGLKIYTVFKASYADKYLRQIGPIEFITYIKNARCVISNSFHATAFSLIFNKEFFVFNRQEAINTRMRDLLSIFNIPKRLIANSQCLQNFDVIDYHNVEKILCRLRQQSESYITNILMRGCKDD